MELIELGTREKHMAETNLNMDSSRSHTIYTFNLVHKEASLKRIISSCRIVDLAGSERSSRTNVSGERTKEAGAINNDLMNLMQYLRNLAENNRTQPRNCKLTRMLNVVLRDIYYIGLHEWMSRGTCSYDY